ncbi:MAG: AAA family ATPase, partial [Acidimicrobiia bacterium]
MNGPTDLRMPDAGPGEPVNGGAEMMEGVRLGPSLSEALWRFRWLVIAAVLVAGGAGYGLSYLQATTYQAQAGMILTDPRISGAFQDSTTGIGDLSRYVRNQAEFVESTAVATRAAELLTDSLGIGPGAVAGASSATPSADLDLVTVKATYATAAGAAAIANAVADAYQQLVLEEVQDNATAAIAELATSKTQMQGRVDDLDDVLATEPDNLAVKAERDAAVAQLVTLDTRIEQINVNMALYGSGVQFFEAAKAPSARSTPKPVRNAAAAAILGLLGAGAFAWWRTERQPLAEDRHDPAPVLGAPLLGEIPEFATAGGVAPAPTVNQPNSVAAEAYRFVASSLEFALDQVGGSMVLITSPDPGNGKTVTALNAAVATVGDGSRVLLVDADERVRGLTRMGGKENAAGLTDLVRRDDLELIDCLERWQVSNSQALSVVPAGSKVSSTSGLFRSPAFQKAMAVLRNAAPMVLFDSPPLLAASEAMDIAAQVDGVVLVVEQGTPLRVVEEARVRLAMTAKPL